MPSGTNTAVVYTPRFYPTLSSVVSEDQIPDILGFIKDGLFLILNKVHYKDLQYNKSINGDAAFYSLSIVAKDRLDFEIPGTEVFVVLNPDVDGADDNISSFPITIEYEWKVLGYLRAFNLNQFDFSPRAIFDMALRILNISEEQALANFINIFAEADATTTSLQRFVNDVNTELSTNLTTPTNETTLTEVAQEIYAQTNNYASVAAFSTYILHSSDADQTKAKLKLYFLQILALKGRNL